MGLCGLFGGVLALLITLFTWQYWVINISGVFLIHYFVYKKREPKEKKEPLLRGIDDIKGKPIKGIDY